MLRNLDIAIMQNPEMQRRLQEHRQHRAPCIFCRGPFAHVAVYYKLDELVEGHLFTALYNVCARCLDDTDTLMQACEAEYAKDRAMAAQELARRGKASWN